MVGTAFTTQDIVFLLVLSAALWPGYHLEQPLEPPQKGYWTVGSIFWPLRRAYHALSLADPALLSAFRNTLRLAVFFAFAADLVTHFPTLTGFMPDHWLAIDMSIVALLIGRASGFWSAGRRVRRTDRVGAETNRLRS